MAAPDLILHGATLVGLDGGLGEGRDAPPCASPCAVAVTGGIVTAVGAPAEILATRARGTQTLDLAGAFLTAGLTDGHIHAVSGVETQVGADLFGADSVPAVAARLAAEAARIPPGAWVQAHSLNPDILGALAEGRAEIEAAVAGRPAFLMGGDYHSAFASRQALLRAGIEGPRTFASGSAILCDASGLPTGPLIEADAYLLVQAAIPPLSFAERTAALLATLRAMAATGLTAGHVMDANGDCFDLLRAIEAAGTLPLRLTIAPWVNPGARREELDHVLAQQAWRGAHWRVGAAKFFIDGTIDAGTAWLLEPDTEGGGGSAFWPDIAAYDEAIRFFALHGVQTVTHAIGDAAVRHVLDVLQSIPEGPRRAARHRIEHLESLPDADIPRFAHLGVVPSMQPTHATRFLSADQADGWSRRLGPARAVRAFRCRDLADTGAPLVLGSDWPVAPFDARAVLAAARARREPHAPAATAIRPDQALDARTALAGLTANPAFAIGEEAVSGRIAPGLRADITAFSVHPLAAPTDELATAPIRLTMMDGRITHST